MKIIKLKLYEILYGVCLDSVLFEILFGIITVAFFVMWCMWDKKMVENIKRWIACAYDANDIFFEKICYPNIAVIFWYTQNFHNTQA